MAIYDVTLQNSIKKQTYFLSDNEYLINEKVIVTTDCGEQLGVVKNIVNSKEKVEKVNAIVRKATKKDYDKYLKNLEDAKKVFNRTKELIEKRNLNMSVVNTEYSLNKDFLLFNFVADERIDFRELVKELASIYHTRIELRQIGVRDKARKIGGYGMCGLKLCCSTCLKNVNSVNIGMVKNQNIALNPTKINGVCGRLLCCFTYENDNYKEANLIMPKINDKVVYNGEEATVIGIKPLEYKYTIKYSNGKLEEVILDGKK